MATKEYWKIDSQTEKEEHLIRGINELSKFSFKVRRYKDIYSGLEVLKISAYYDGTDYGTIVGQMAKLDTELSNLLDIGINLSRLELVELRTIIGKNYYCLKPLIGESIENNIPDKLVNKVLQHFKEYIVENKIEKKDGFYNIPVADFKNEINDSVFRHYNISDIKEALRIRKFTKCNANRNDFAIKDKDTGKNFRCISFDADVIDKVK